MNLMEGGATCACPAQAVPVLPKNINQADPNVLHIGPASLEATQRVVRKSEHFCGEQLFSKSVVGKCPRFTHNGDKTDSCTNAPRDKKTRIGRNPKTGEDIEISARRVVTFKGSPVLKAKMNDTAP